MARQRLLGLFKVVWHLVKFLDHLYYELSTDGARYDSAHLFRRGRYLGIQLGGEYMCPRFFTNRLEREMEILVSKPSFLDVELHKFGSRFLKLLRGHRRAWCSDIEFHVDSS